MYKYLKIRNDGNHRPLNGIYHSKKVNTLKESNIRVSRSLHYLYSMDITRADVPMIVRSHLSGPLPLNLIMKQSHLPEDRLQTMASDVIRSDIAFPITAADRDMIVWSDNPPDTSAIYI